MPPSCHILSNMLIFDVIFVIANVQYSCLFRITRLRVFCTAARLHKAWNYIKKFLYMGILINLECPRYLLRSIDVIALIWHNNSFWPGNEDWFLIGIINLPNGWHECIWQSSEDELNSRANSGKAHSLWTRISWSYSVKKMHTAIVAYLATDTVKDRKLIIASILFETRSMFSFSNDTHIHMTMI